VIIIIDYGMGNLKSVYNALKNLDIPCKISSSIDEISKADSLILPGVGAFKDAVDNLKELDLVDVIKAKVSEGTPLLGICLGMQMLYEKGYEVEEREGLGFLKGEIRLMEPKEKLKIPHIGWNRLEYTKDSSFRQIDKEEFVYYVHSYRATNIDEEQLVAYSQYGEFKIPGLEIGRASCRERVY
jgi:glutamine amidotransferase